jgi:hypothetical protein
MPDEGSQQIGSLIQPLPLLDEHRPQLGPVLGGEVGQPAVLRVAPDRLLGVQLRGVARERLGDDLGCLAREARTTLARSCTLPLSHRTIIGPEMDRRNCRSNATVSSPWTFLSSGSRWKYRPSRLRFELTVRALRAEIRSCRAQLFRIGVCLGEPGSDAPSG